jgi:hypothetical protein
MGPRDETCEGCRYFDSRREQCRFTAPQVVVANGTPEALWPRTTHDEWCGEWTPPKGRVDEAFNAVAAVTPRAPQPPTFGRRT